MRFLKWGGSPEVEVLPVEQDEALIDGEARYGLENFLADTAEPLQEVAGAFNDIAVKARTLREDENIRRKMLRSWRQHGEINNVEFDDERWSQVLGELEEKVDTLLANKIKKDIVFYRHIALQNLGALETIRRSRRTINNSETEEAHDIFLGMRKTYATFTVFVANKMEHAVKHEGQVGSHLRELLSGDGKGFEELIDWAMYLDDDEIETHRELLKFLAADVVDERGVTAHVLEDSKDRPEAFMYVFAKAFEDGTASLKQLAQAVEFGFATARKHNPNLTLEQYLIDSYEDWPEPLEKRFGPFRSEYIRSIKAKLIEHLHQEHFDPWRGRFTEEDLKRSEGELRRSLEKVEAYKPQRNGARRRRPTTAPRASSLGEFIVTQTHEEVEPREPAPIKLLKQISSGTFVAEDLSEEDLEKIVHDASGRDQKLRQDIRAMLDEIRTKYHDRRGLKILGDGRAKISIEGISKKAPLLHLSPRKRPGFPTHTRRSNKIRVGFVLFEDSDSGKKTVGLIAIQEHEAFDKTMARLLRVS